jgi:hypothetical protein
LELKNISKIVTKIFEVQDENGCWQFPHSRGKYPQYDHYMPKYRSTLWTLILLAEIKHSIKEERVSKAVKTLVGHFYNKKKKVFSLGYDHFPIPCLNGNMLYIYFYFGNEYNEIIDNVIEFFNKYQRFDDGDFRTPKQYPYFSNRSCYGRHTCFWGVIKLLKGLSFIPKEERTASADSLIKKCVDFILLHKVCFRSRRENSLLHPAIDMLTFPGMYSSDFLEILWLLKREGVCDSNISSAIELLKSKMMPGMRWKLERPVHNMITSVGKKDSENEFITERAKEVLDFYNKILYLH